MAKFLAFEEDGGNEVYVNASLVRVVRSAGERLTEIEFDDEHKVGHYDASQSRCQRPREGGLRKFTAFEFEPHPHKLGLFHCAWHAACTLGDCPGVFASSVGAPDDLAPAGP